MLKKFKYDPKSINKETREQLQDFQATVELILRSEMNILRQKVKVDKDKYFEKNYALIEMQKTIVDRLFARQLQDAKKETKEFFNDLMKDLAVNNVSKQMDFYNMSYLFQSQPSHRPLIIGETKFGKNAS